MGGVCEQTNSALRNYIYIYIYIYTVYSQTWLKSHCLQHQPLCNNTHGRNRFNGLCTKCPGCNNNLVITARFSGTKGVVNKFDLYRYMYVQCSLHNSNQLSTNFRLIPLKFLNQFLIYLQYIDFVGIFLLILS